MSTGTLKLDCLTRMQADSFNESDSASWLFYDALTKDALSDYDIFPHLFFFTHPRYLLGYDFKCWICYDISLAKRERHDMTNDPHLSLTYMFLGGKA